MAQANTDPEEISQEAAVPEVASEELGTEDKVNLTIVDSDAGPDAGAAGTSVKTARFAPLGPSQQSGAQNTMDLIFDVPLELSVELGRASIPVRDVLQLGPGSVVELDKLGGEPVDVLVNGRLIARGEVVVVDENFGVRVTEIVNKEQVRGCAS